MTANRAPRLEIAADVLASVREVAAQAYPNEGCGLLLGVEVPSPDRAEAETVLRVTRLVPTANRHPEPRTGFEVDPAVLIRVLRDLREAERSGQGMGERLLGHMHSHPDAPASPSARDLAMAYEPGHVWLIVPVAQGRPGAPRAFQAVADGGETVSGFRALRIEAPVLGDGGRS